MSIQANKLMNLADGKVLYDDLRDRIETLIDNIAAEDTATATAAHAVNDVITVGGKLYKVTAAIAIGDTITDTGNGANVTGTTVDELIGAVKNNPTFTGTLTLGSTSMTESQLSTLLSFEAAAGQSF